MKFYVIISWERILGKGMEANGGTQYRQQIRARYMRMKETEDIVDAMSEVPGNNQATST